MVFVVGMEEQRRMEVGGGSRVAGVPGPGDARGVEKLVVQHHHPQSRSEIEKKRNNLVEFLI